MKTLSNKESCEQAAVLVSAVVIAHQLSVTPRYVLQLAAAKRIPCIRIGHKCVRFDQKKVAEVLGINGLEATV